MLETKTYLDSQQRPYSAISEEDSHLLAQDRILACMTAVGGWFGFGEYDNVQAVIALEKEGLIEFDQNYNNRVSPIFTSIRARALNVSLRNSED